MDAVSNMSEPTKPRIFMCLLKVIRVVYLAPGGGALPLDIRVHRPRHATLAPTPAFGQDAILKFPWIMQKPRPSGGLLLIGAQQIVCASLRDTLK
jgi:hypothetical protein